MRPNIDIPWSVHGQIKEYAQAEEKTIEEAYIETLEEGLSGMPAPVQSDQKLLDSSIDDGSLGLRTFPVSTENALQINDLCTFIPRPSLPSQPVIFTADPQQITVETLIDGLSRLSSILNGVRKEWFTFHQLGGSWVGTGMENFTHCLRTLGDRLDEADFETYKTGFGVYFLGLGEREYLVLLLELDGSSGLIESFNLGFLTDGHPIDGGRYRKLAAQFGVSTLENGKDRNVESFSLTLGEDIYVDVLEQTVKSENRDDPWVNGLIIRNPIQQHEELRTAVLNLADDDFLNRPEYKNPYELLSSYDRAYVRLTDHHPKSENHDYRLNAIHVTDFTPIFDRQEIWNLSISANW